MNADGYQSKWNLGDFTTVLDEEYGVSLMEQILEVEETCDNTGYAVIPTFGIPEKTIAEAVGSSGGKTAETEAVEILPTFTHR